MDACGPGKWFLDCWVTPFVFGFTAPPFFYPPMTLYDGAPEEKIDTHLNVCLMARILFALVD